MVKASNPATSPEDLKGKRISAAKGSTSELSVNLNGSEPVTFRTPAPPTWRCSRTSPSAWWPTR